MTVGEQMPYAIRVAIVWLIDVFALIVVDWLFSGLSVGRWGPLLFAAALLALANAFLKPLLAVLALPFIVITLGVGYFLVTLAVLWFVQRVAPDFVISGFWTYVGVAFVIWLVHLVLRPLLGVPKRSAARRFVSRG